MGFFSYLCSKSGESIPADAVCETEVVAFLPNGKTIQGVYDGYGRIGGHDWVHDLQFNENSPVEVLNSKCTGCVVKEQPWAPGRVNIVADLNVEAEVTINGKPQSVKTTASYAINSPDEASGNGQQLFEEKRGFIERDIKFDASASMLRVIKAKYFDPFKDSYDTIAPSRSCPHQGYFYDDDYDFNEPHDEQSGPKMRG